MTVKQELLSRGYRFPKFKTPKARARFVAKHGYDPVTTLNAARRAKDGAGPGWENAFPLVGKAKKKE